MPTSRWRFQSLSDVGRHAAGGRAWYRMAPPGWFAEEGWALTPETAGIARLMGRGPSIGADHRLGPAPRTPVFACWSAGAIWAPPRTRRRSFMVSVDGSRCRSVGRRPGILPARVRSAGRNAGRGEGLRALTIESRSAAGAAVATAIEQFDLQSAGTLMWGYDEGWHEAEYNPALGVWRWTSDRATLRIVDASTPVAVTLRVERPRATSMSIRSCA